MGNEGVVAIAKAAENLVKLKLYLCNVNVTMEGVRTALEHKPTAELEDLVLGLSWKSIVSSDIYSLDKAMSCGHLPMLELISSDFINKVESLVATNEHIRKIKGLQCYVKPDTLPQVCNIMKSMNNLQKIDIDHSDFNVDSVVSIKSCILDCHDLSSIILRGLCGNSLYSVAAAISNNLISLAINGRNSDDSLPDLFLNPSKWGNLRTLYLSGIQFYEEDNFLLVCRVITHCRDLICLNLSDCLLDNSHVDVLAECLKNSFHLEELYLGCNSLGLYGIVKLANIIEHNRLRVIEISGIKLVSSGGKSLIKASVAENFTFRTIYQNIFGFSDEVFEHEYEMNSEEINYVIIQHQECTKLVEVDVSGNLIDSNGIKSILCQLVDCNHLAQLNLSRNAICSMGMKDIVSDIIHFEGLICLDLSFNNITSESCHPLF